MELIQTILTDSACYQAGRTIRPQGIMVHSMGVAQPNPEVFTKLWNKSSAQACVHALVAEDAVLQLLPWNRRGWHAGSAPNGGTSANNTHISFEILEPSGHSYNGGTMIGYDVMANAAYFAKVYQNAVDLCAYLCKEYNFNPETDILCHSEGHSRNMASNHADVMHWFPKHGKTMDSFRADVKAALSLAVNPAPAPTTAEEPVQPQLSQEAFHALFDQAIADYTTAQQAQPVSSWAEEAWEKAVSAGIFDGSAPTSPLTREQMSLVLDRLGLVSE